MNVSLSPKLSRNINLGHHQRSSQMGSVLIINMYWYFPGEEKSEALSDFFYDYNDMILQLEPRFVIDDEQTE